MTVVDFQNFISLVKTLSIPVFTIYGLVVGSFFHWFVNSPEFNHVEVLF
jgi:hypothetical protein